MGRLFEITKQMNTPSPSVANGPTTIPFTEPALSPRIISDVESELDLEIEADVEGEACEDIPFIEVGPHRSMEASASVLASGPLPKTNLPKVDLDEPMLVPPANHGCDSRGTQVKAEEPQPVVFRPSSSKTLLRRRQSKLAAELIAFHDPDHAVSGQYHNLLTAMCQGCNGRGATAAQSLLFTSILADVPTTTVMLNLAITAARLGRRRIAVLDANLHKPGIAERLGLSEEIGLRQVLSGSAKVDEALQKTEQENLFALTTGAENLGGGMRFVAETLRSAVRQVRQRFDLVFVDGPIWDGKNEVTQAAVACDAVVLVLPQTEADSPRVEALFQELPDKGIRLAGCVIVGQ
jgi:Mrp family chromosome partitioning ATPase